MKTIKRNGFWLLRLILVLGTCVPSLAQEQWEKEGEGEIKDMEIEMTKERHVVLPRATRYFEKVPPRPFEPIVPAIRYEFKAIPFSSPNYSPVIRPLRLKQEDQTKLYGNYLSAGLGNYQSFFAEGAVATKRDKTKMIGADFFWRSSGKGPVDESHSANSSTRVMLFGKRVMDAVTMSGDLTYLNQRNYFYGYAPGTDIDRDLLKQVYETFAARAGIENSRKATLDYKLDVGYSHLRDAYVSTEGQFSMKFNGTYALEGNRSVVLDADAFLINRKDSLFSESRNLVHLRPSYSLRPMDKLSLSLGINMALQNDVFSESNSLNVYPNVSGRYEASEKIALYASISGDIDRVNMHTLTALNPWLKANSSITNTNRALDFQAGVEANIGSKLTTRIGAGFATLKNLYFFQTVRDPFNPAGIPVGADVDKFELVYDKATGRMNPYMEATYNESDVFSMTLRADYFKYTTETIAQAWHRPTYRTDLQLKYSLYSKLIFQAGIVAQGGMVALDPVVGEVTLQQAFDVNFRTRYFFSKQISAFIQFDNLLSNQYPLYLSYPTRGFQALVGASWSF